MAVRWSGLDHVCPGCSVPAEIAPAAAPYKGQIVTVPHEPGCRVAASAARMRAMPLPMQCPAGGVHSWVDAGGGKVRCAKCGAVETRGR